MVNAQNFFCEWIFHIFLQRSFKRACPVLLIKALIGNKVLRAFSELKIVPKVFDPFEEILSKNIDDLEDIFPFEWFERENIIYPVKEFRIKDFLESILDGGFHLCVIERIIRR